MSEECPYCGEYIEICHDDGYGYEENEVYNQTCEHCGNTFIFETEISFSYTLRKAPCLNGGEHRLGDIIGFPKELFIGKKKCIDCGEEILIDKDANKKAIEMYYDFKKLNNKLKQGE